MYKKKISSLLAAVIVAGMVTGSMPVCVNAQETTGNAGTTYYVDAENGDDSNSGTSIDAPWKSLNKVTDTTFLPGDQILLKSGSVGNGYGRKAPVWKERRLLLTSTAVRRNLL